jgi:hypothetical protein
VWVSPSKALQRSTIWPLLEADNFQFSDGDRFSGGWLSEQLAGVGSGPGEASADERDLRAVRRVNAEVVQARRVREAGDGAPAQLDQI